MKRLGLGIAAFLLAAVVAGVAIDAHLSIPEEAPVPVEVRRWAIASMRAAVAGQPAPPAPADPSLSRPLPAPLVASVFSSGRQRARVTASGTLREAIARAGRALATEGGAAARDPAARIRVEIPVARGALVAAPMLLPLELIPGRDGLGVEVGDETAVRTSLELTGMRLWDRAFTGGKDAGVGLSIDPVLDAFAQDLGTPHDQLAAGEGSFFRFRVATLVEVEPGRLLEETDPPRRPSRQVLMDAAVGAARWCQAVMGANGKYTYMYDPLEDREDPGGGRYNLPRHAGTTYYLGQAARYTHDEDLATSAGRALDWMLDKNMRRCGPLKRRCIRDTDVATLGSTALAVIAISEWRHATGDHRHDDDLRRLGQYLRDMQKPDGNFHHRYSRRADRVLPGQLLYYTGETALALLKIHEELGDPRDLAAAKKALDFLTGHGWDFFYDPYYFSEEHWTCIAANEAYPRLKERRYLEHCDAFARYRRRAQYRPGEIQFPDATGGYGFGAFATPRTTPAASTTEAMISTALLHRKWGGRSEVIENQVWDAIRFLLRHQLGPAEEHMLVDPRRARGGFPASKVEWTIRIDFTQHAGSAILRSTDLL